MKKTNYFIVYITIFIMACTSQEKIANIDLLNNSNEYEVKVNKKNIEFGPYFTSKTKRKRFTSYESSVLGVEVDDPKEVYRFTIHKKDFKMLEVTAIGEVDADRIEDFKKYATELNGNNILLASIKDLSTVNQWELVIQNAYKGLESSGKPNGELTNGKQIIKIKALQLDTTSQSSNQQGVTDGYEFIKDGQSIGAVQTKSKSKHKRYIWIDKSLPEDEKLVLAAAASTLIIKGGKIRHE